MYLKVFFLFHCFFIIFFKKRTFSISRHLQLTFPRSFTWNIYLLGGSMVSCDGIPVTTVATNSGVTFEEKLDAMDLNNPFFFLVLYSKTAKAKINCMALR